MKQEYLKSQFESGIIRDFQLHKYSTFQEEKKEKIPTKKESNNQELQLQNITENTQSDLLNKSPSVSIWDDKYPFLLLFGIYTCCGLALGYFGSALTVILTKIGASYAQLSILSFVDYSFSFKFLWAPLCDAYYIKGLGLGKRKTYIVLAYYLSGITLFICAFYVNDWVLNLEVGILTAIGFFIIFLITFESIGTDAWSVCILHPENISLASFALNAGEDFGVIISYNLFIWLNLRGGDTLEEQAANEIMSSKALFFIMGVLFMFVGALTHFGKKEVDTYEKDEESLIAVIKKLKGFFYNKNLLFLICVFTFSEFSFSCIENVGYIILIQKGFSTDLIDGFDLISTFIGMLGYFVSVNFSKKKKEWTVFLICITLRFVVEILLFLVINFYDMNTNDSIMVVFYGLLVNIDAIIIDCYYLATYSFILRISEGNMHVGATFITVLACFSNFGPSWSYTASLWLLEYLSFQMLAYISWVYGLLFFGTLWRKIQRMEELTEEEWKL